MIVVKELGKIFATREGEVCAVNQTSFQVQKGEFYTLLGPSGCGKTTTLRCIAGLEKPTTGDIFLNNRLVASASTFVPPEERGIGMVFQSYAIWPHLTVFDNAAFPLKHGKVKLSKTDIKGRVMEALALAQIEELAQRPAPLLSGGQQQRVALARALVSRPQVLLLDEPLSNLDAKLREELRLEIKELVRRVGITTVYVTHDQSEALAMSDRIAVMLNGKILQEGKPKELYLSPNSKFVAQFIGQINFIEGSVLDTAADGKGIVECAEGRIRCSLPPRMTKGEGALVAVRPEELRAAKRPGSLEENTLEGRVEKAVFLGDFVDCQVSVHGRTIRAKLHPSDDFAEGDQIFLLFDPRSCVVISRHPSD
ncbi:MAG: ABC transporter ATP-binding protein [Deltaproteobacteria bacterium]|nr:ABC transporter ATP-binding protein [Deltaproteobacteria bacterium]